MRFADTNVLAREQGSEPLPLEVRLDLRPGDRVGLYEEVRHSSMGAGYSPLEVVVIDSPEPGWFMWESEDGRQVLFHPDQVADVCHSSMGGIFDWVKKILPTPRPTEPQGRGLVQVPSPEERRGLIKSVKEFFGPMAAIPKEGEATGRSIFDVFRKPKVPVGLPAERGSSALAPVTERPSLISVIQARQSSVTPFVEKIMEPARYIQPGQKTVIPFVEAMLAPAVVIPASPEPVPYEVRQQQEKELWTEVVGQMAPEEVSVSELVKTMPSAPPRAPLSEIVKGYAASDVRPESEVRPPTISDRLAKRLKTLPMPRRGTVIPSVEEVARGLATFYQPLEELWELFRRARTSPDWQDNIDKLGIARESFETLGACGQQPTIYEEISSFFHVPWEELRNRAVVEESEDTERWLNTDRIWLEIITPLMDRVTQAFNLMKPADLPGEVIVERADAHGTHVEPCSLTISYVEGEEQEEQEEPERTEFTVEEIEEGIRNVEAELVSLVEAKDALNPSDPEFQEKLSYFENQIQERQEIWRQMNEALPDPEEPKAKRASKKSKSGKKGKR